MGEGAEAERPDKTGVVVDGIDLPLVGYVVALFEAVEGSLTTPFATEITQEHLNAGAKVVHLPLVAENTLFVPENLLAVMPEIFLGLNGKKCKIIFRK